MSEAPAAAGIPRWAGSLVTRSLRAWRVLPPERRLAAGASIGLFATLFLPWYQGQGFESRGGKLQQVSNSSTGWGAFSFVEAAVLLVAVGVLVLLVQRAEGRAFHLPGGDGAVIMVAGVWTCGLIVWRIFDKQGGAAHGQIATASGIEWGIFAALVVAALLTYSGSRIRAAHRPEPPLPGEPGARREPGPAEQREPGPAGHPAPRPAEQREPGPAGHPAPVPAEPRARGSDEPQSRGAPSSSAVPEEQLTIPLEREE